MLGGSQDENGCLTSAGYKWCESEQSCVRPWELAQTAQIENTEEAFNLHCSGQSTSIGGADEYGCVSSAGYKWCESEQSCVRPWELAQTAQIENTEEAFNQHCSTQLPSGPDDCIASAGYSWCESEQSCVRPWELAQTAQIENTEEAFVEHCGASCSPEDEGSFYCSQFCGSDAFERPVCVSGRWACPEGTVSVDEDCEGVCIGVAPKGYECVNGKW
eukprot:CAMPEP_0174274904 /NCGR_PEP_ID=MMETSP0439-20130205/59531_1 /TAXON_ID=0 /ORGANISM="Stereomyxa ramosa, Strain Chinc5" /LENGTH=216 /DNA_ID=CAMNT_0015366953 /DNA_START=102 /DNA_END=749 /DNA_ORIENTATION=+